MSTSTIRYGPGVSKEIGYDLKHLNGKNVCVFVDKNLVKMKSVQTAFDSLTKNQINYKTFDDIRVEPTDSSLMKAVKFARQNDFDAYVAIGKLNQGL